MSRAPGRGLAALLVLLFALAPMRAPAADPLLADLSSHLIAITTGFTGSDVVLFGATDGPGDVVVLVRGPEREQVVRRKGRVAGLWINVESLSFLGVPSFFAMAASRPVEQFTGEALRLREQFGLDYLRLEPKAFATPAKTAEFRSALIRAQQAADLYSDAASPILFLGDRLFRTTIGFPANVPTGTYAVEVFLIREGEVVAAQSTPLVVSKIGVGADIADFAHRFSALYGLIAVLGAVMAGWLAGIILRRV